MKLLKLIPILFAAAMLTCNVAFADLAPLPEDEACVDLMEGDACTFTNSDDEEVSGACADGRCIPSSEEAPAGEEVPVAGEEAPAAGEEAPAAGEETPAAGEEAPAAGEEPPEAGEEAPAAGEEAPEAGEEAPAAGEEPPEAGEEAPEAGEESSEEADSGDDDDGGCDQSSNRGQSALITVLALLGLSLRRRRETSL